MSAEMEASPRLLPGQVPRRWPQLTNATSTGRKRIFDRSFRFICQGAAILILVIAALIVTTLISEAWMAIRVCGLDFFTSQTWDPEPSHRQFGALAFIFGTITTSAIAMAIAVPLGIGTAAFLSEIAPPWLRRSGSFLVEMLAAVPSVVYGFWGLFVLAPAMQWMFTAVGGPNQGGVGILAAGILLSIMIVPYVAAVSYDVCLSVPRSQREGALALGATRWQVIRTVVLPYGKSGILGGCFLALGRALGETMAVTMLIGNRAEIRLSPFALGNSIASVIANEFTEATYDLYLSALAELGLVLLLVSVVVNATARRLLRGMDSSRRGKTLLRLILAKLGRSNESPPAKVVPVRDDAYRPPTRVVRSLSHRHSKWIDWLATVLLGLCWVITIGPLIMILAHLFYHGMGALNWEFFTRLPAPVGETGGGLANALLGSLILVGLATLFAVPIGVLSAVFLKEYHPGKLGECVRFVGELMNGVPSIVIGIVVYHVVVLRMGHFSGWAGAFALAIIMVPIVMRASEEALKLVPETIRHASYALGANRYQTVLRAVVPAAIPAITTGVFLAIARIGGETAPLLLTASSNQYWPSSPNDFMPSLPVYIFTYAVSPYDDWHRQAWGAALVLMAAVMLLNFGVRSLGSNRLRLRGQSE